jgi:hypothetical protein
MERVLAGLPASSDSVADPDHPFLLHGPDVLASINGRLTAYFILDEQVSRLPMRLLSNVVLARLALPLGTSFVLILGEAAEIRESDSQIFEEVVAASANKLAKYPAGRMRESRGGEAVEVLRTPHNERFGMAWSLTSERRGRKRRERRRVISDRPTSIGRLDVKAPRISAPYLNFHNGSFILTQPAPEIKASARELLERASYRAVQADYWLDLGAPGVGEVAQVMRSRNSYLALHQSKIPLPVEVRRFDVLKPFRAAAFAGFAVGRTEDPNDA